MDSPYGDPAFYDVLMARGTARELDVLERLERRFAPRFGPGARWLEPACGSGRLLRGARRRGRRVAGYDHDPAMVAYARTRLERQRGGPPWRVRVADLADPASSLSALEGADFALCPWNTLRHLLDDRAVLAHLAQVAALLRPGGVYAVGLSLRDFSLPAEDEDVWQGARGPLRVTQIVNYLPLNARRERVISHLVVERPRATLHFDTAFDLRTYAAAQWARLVARSALSRLAVCDAAGRPVAFDAPLPYRFEILHLATGPLENRS